MDSCPWKKKVHISVTDVVSVGHCAAPHDESREDIRSVVFSKQQVMMRKMWGELAGRFYMLNPGDMLSAKRRELLQSRSWN